jgi:16S rRNA (uracil1498-N3)-methyltransferase
MIRLYVPDDLRAGAEVVLSADHSHYLQHVMRQSVGGGVELFNGRDGAFAATLTTAHKKGCVVTLGMHTRAQTPPSGVRLMLALIKRARLEWAVEKATEMGVDSIQLLITDRTQSDHVKAERLQAIATEAAEQCERLDVPQIHAPKPLKHVLASWGEQPLVFCDEALAGAGQTGTAAMQIGSDGLDILIGPEGGFSSDERAHIRAMDAVIPIALGPLVLRADTAVVAALATVRVLTQ